MKKLTAVCLVVFMLLGLGACGQNPTPPASPTPGSEPGASVENSQSSEGSESSETTTQSESSADASSTSNESQTGESSEVEDDAILGYEDPKEFTYQSYLGTTPNNWNPLTNSTVDDGEVLSMIDSGLYSMDFVPEHPETGYRIKCEMAKELPEDITADYAGKPEWNVPADAKEGYAYRIKLIDYAKWDDGTPINADTFIYSAQQWLDPKQQNLRADMAYSNEFVITRAKDYLYSGKEDKLNLFDFASVNKIEKLSEVFEKFANEKVFVNWAEFGEMYDKEAKKWVDDKDKVKDEIVALDLTLAEFKPILEARLKEKASAQPEEKASEGEEKQSEEKSEEENASEGEASAPEEKSEEDVLAEQMAGLVRLNYKNPEVPWEKVGFQKEDDHTILLILDKPLKGFYFYYSLSTPLVRKDLYEKYKVKKGEGDLITSKYGTSLEKSASSGPYKLEKFQDDKIVSFVRNENWYGYHDDNHKGLYQADRIVYEIVKEPATQLQMFLKGKLDGLGLTVDQVKDYKGSDYIIYTPGQYTGSLQMNADIKSLQARQKPGLNKTILSIKDFRKALAWSVDRDDYTKAVTASSIPGFGLLNSRYIADVETLTPYRSYEPAKKALLEVYGLEYGEGKNYKTLDDAYKALTGYDLDSAKKLFDSAYDQAIEQGLMKPTDKVSLDYYASEDNENVRRGFNYLKNNWEKAMKGTKLEGKFELNLDATAGNDFAENFKKGLSDIMQAGWSGAAFNPFYLISAYINKEYRYAQSFDITQPLTIKVGSHEELTMPLDVWYEAMMGNLPPDKPNFGPDKATIEERIEILAAIEKAILLDYTSTPISYSVSAVLKSKKVENYIQDFNLLLGYGSGPDYRTFNYTDSEWSDYVAEQGGELDYK